MSSVSTSSVHVIVVTGLPGTGKTTLARELAARYRMPLLAKDCIKEPLLDVLGPVDAAQSRLLSDASFASLFRLARELRLAGASFLLEGNFRSAEHEAALRDAVDTARVAQVLCRVPEVERVARLRARAADPARHAGHRVGEQLSAASPSKQADAFLDVPSARFVHDGAGSQPVFRSLDDWMNLRATSP
jgi:predicted kinase